MAEINLRQLRFATEVTSAICAAAEIKIESGHKNGDGKKPVVWWVSCGGSAVANLPGCETEDEAKSAFDAVSVISNGIKELAHSNLREFIKNLAEAK